MQLLVLVSFGSWKRYYPQSFPSWSLATHICGMVDANGGEGLNSLSMISAYSLASSSVDTFPWTSNSRWNLDKGVRREKSWSCISIPSKELISSSILILHFVVSRCKSAVQDAMFCKPNKSENVHLYQSSKSFSILSNGVKETRRNLGGCPFAKNYAA